MKVVFRVDASLEMGTGHVMRCLTLAKIIRDDKNDVFFISREHEGNLNKLIEENGFQVFKLSSIEISSTKEKDAESGLYHSSWLGATQQQDAEHCQAILKTLDPDWMIVDQYAIDFRWQIELQPFYKKLMVIDDLADRTHKCDLLLDQTFGREDVDYKHLVPEHCQLLLGSHFALLRKEFSEWRAFSIDRRKKPEFRNILITMGGVDKENITSRILCELKSLEISEPLKLVVVMGKMSPSLDQVIELAQSMPFLTEVVIDVDNMAELMAHSDIAIGAAGSTSWERCCLGLPTILLVLAQNQALAAEYLEKAQAVKLLRLDENFSYQLSQLIKDIFMHPDRLQEMSDNAMKITDGQGAMRVLSAIQSQQS